MSGESELSDEYRGSHTCERQPKSNKESTADEHADILGCSLNDCSNDDHFAMSRDTMRQRSLTDITEKQSPTSAESIVRVWGEGKTCDTANRLDGIEDTEQ